MRTTRPVLAAGLLLLGMLAGVAGPDQVGAATPFAITSAPPSSSATFGEPYDHQLTASEEATWAVTAGALPLGLTLDPTTGELAGTPTGSGLHADITVTATQRSFAAVSAGEGHTCGLSPGGATDCWGANESGQATDQPGPSTAIATGGAHTCALTPAGAADCWGNDSSGQATDQPGPYTAIAAGAFHTCALTPAGAADCWGNDGAGQSTDQPGPYTAIATGGAHTCALTPAGAADCWGIEQLGQADDQPGPYTQVTAGSQHSCALTPLGAVDCWGADGSGQATDQPPTPVTATQTFSIEVAPAVTSPLPHDGIVGQGYTHQLRTDPPAASWAITAGTLPDGLTLDPTTGTITGTPTTPGASADITVTSTTRGYSALDAGRRFSCALTRTGAADCWGGNFADQPGPYTTVSAGYAHACALTPTGAAECWGSGGDDQPGPYTAISVGAHHTCALTPTGAADCWGSDTFGRATDQPGPYTAIVASTRHTCALTPTGAADCWGSNFRGESVDQPGPYTAITAGDYHTCALTPTGAADCWGSDSLGRATDQPGPYTAISAAEYHNCALTPTGAVDCWGDDGWGQATDQPGPYTAVSSGFDHTCGLTPTGAADCWGDNAYQQAVDQEGPEAGTTSVTFSITVGESRCAATPGAGPFPDVGATHPFCSDIEWMASNTITGGFADGTFRPTTAVSRQAMASFLHAYQGRPPVTPAEPFFADVPATHRFFEPIQWMAQTGLSTGSPNPAGGKPLFNPTTTVSRQAMAAFLWRDAGEPTAALTEPFFADIAADHPFYDAIQWMADSGLSLGVPGPTGTEPAFQPGTPVSRQTMAAFLHRYDEL